MIGTLKCIKTYYYFASFTAIAIVLNLFYLRTANAGFVFDMTEWLYDYSKHPNFNLLHPPFDNNLRPVYHFLLYNTYKFFGVGTKAWYILSLSLFYLSICSFHVFISKLYLLFQVPHYRRISSLTTIAIAISPFGSEIVVWYATIHYSIVFICLFCSLSLILKWKDNLIRVAPFSTLLFILAILSIELSYSIVPICFSLFLLLYYSQKTASSIQKFLILILLPQTCIFLTFNFINYFHYDNFLGHYSIEKTDFEIFYLITHYLKIFVKHSFFINILGQSIYEPIYNFIDEFALPISLILVSFLLYAWYAVKAKMIVLRHYHALTLFLFSSSIFLYIPISFLFFHNWKEIELDRLGFGTMMFGISMVFLLVWHLKNPCIRQLFYFSFFVLSILLLNDYTTRWQKSALVRDQFSNNLPIYENKSVYLIAAPIVFQYAYLISINDSLELKRHIKIFQNSAPNSQYRILGFYNMKDIDDIVSVRKINDSAIHCRVEKWGSWCWFNLKSAIKSYENSQYKLEADEDRLGYKVYFKALDTNSKIILFNKLQFKEINLREKEIGFTYL